MSFCQVGARLSESSDPSVELRIIAHDERRLSVADRACIKEAADEFDELRKLYVEAQIELSEERQKHVALNERLLMLGSRVIALHDQLTAYETSQSWLITVKVDYVR